MMLEKTDLNLKPRLVFWEMTRACALACRHCRAEADPHRAPWELTTKEARFLLQQIREADPEYVVFTGGDPFMRRDTLALVEEATEMGLHVALSPSATPLLARMDFAEIKLSGVQRMSLSLDGATPATHDAFRGVPGTWDLTMRAMARAREVGLPIQINTTVTRDNLEEIHRFPSLLEKIQPANWSLFLVVPVGRAVGEVLPRAQEVEKLFLFLADLSTRVRYHITTTEGMHYRRVVVQQRFGLDMDPRQLPQGTGDGRGVVFISSCGDIQPSGFMPKVVGNVRHDSLLQTYQQHPLFRSLRNPGFLKGKCGRCGFNRLCGGSRARAFAATGDMFQADPLCPYLP